jgi:23S rRNA (uracil1939-C5)-methyltransferase
MPVRVGYRERFRHTLVDLEECPVMEPALLAVVAPLRELARILLAPGEKAEASLTRTDSGVDLVFISSKMPGLTTLQALGDFAEAHDLARITWEWGGREIPVVERRPVRIVFGGVAVAFPPGAFLQASEMAQEMLVEEVLLGVGERRPTLDLFAGLGAFALALAQAGPVHAVEADQRMSAALRQAGASVMKFTVETRDLERNPLPVEALAGYAAAVFDPPRAGAAAQAAALAHSRLERVVAVSCNPATFARDAALLIAGGFRALSIVPIDQFTWTPHLELVAVFER